MCILFSPVRRVRLLGGKAVAPALAKHPGVMVSRRAGVPPVLGRAGAVEQHVLQPPCAVTSRVRGCNDLKGPFLSSTLGLGRTPILRLFSECE